jgi:hypothetical protein
MDGAPIDRVLTKLPDAKRSGNGWTARCPAHEDRHPSLSVGVGREGRVLLRCHAGCPLEAVLAALGLSARDLFLPNHDACNPANDRSGPTNAVPPPRRRVKTVYSYVAEDGTLRFQTVRLEPKGFYQRRPDGHGGWINDLDGVLRVLYRLPELLAALPERAVWLPEGEKDADALADLGLVATTHAGGAGAPWLPQYTDWLRGRKVVLLPDNDAPGRARVRAIARALVGVAKNVRIVELPGLPHKGDVSDWLDAGGARTELVALAKATSVLTEADIAEGAGNSSYGHFFGDGDNADPTNGTGTGTDYGTPPYPRPPVPPFPDDVFPLSIRRYVLEGAAALGVPVDMAAVPLLGFAAGVVGNTRMLRVKQGWIVRAILWLAVVGDPGSGKSPALDHARHPVDALQKLAWDRYQDTLEAWEQDALDAKAAKQPPPDKPALEHFLTTDATTEALASILGTSPGVVLVRDELVGWVKSHDAYRKAGDRQQWLSLWAGAPLKVDRRTSGPVYVPKPTVSVVGGIQPDLLPELAAEANRRDGFIDRNLIAWPDAFPQRWTEATVGNATTRAAEELFAQLRPTFRPQEPALHDLATAAKAAFAAWFDRNAELREQAGGLAAGCYAKYPGQCARLALVLHGLREPEDLNTPVAEGTVLDAIAVVEYFRAHLARVLPAFGAAPPGASTRDVNLKERVARILREGNGAWLARTALHARLGRSVTADDLTSALRALEREGPAEVRSVPTGAKPREEWRWMGTSRAWEDGTAGHEEVPEQKNVESAQSASRRYEDMKNWEQPPGKSSYLHIFDNDAGDQSDDESLRETFL